MFQMIKDADEGWQRNLAFVLYFLIIAPIGIVLLTGTVIITTIWVIAYLLIKCITGILLVIVCIAYKVCNIPLRVVLHGKIQEA